MGSIIAVIGEVPTANLRNDDDWSDRLGYRYTTILLIVFTLVVTSKQYVGEQIDCWVPAHFTENHEEYANSYCWIRNTYYLPYEEYVPREDEPHKRHMISYYQWIPMILLIQALLFYMPIILWRSLNSRSGIDVNNVVEAGETFTNTEKTEERETTLKYMTMQMDRYLMSHMKPVRTTCTISLKNLISSTLFYLCGRRHGNYLVSLFLFVKLISILNVIGQLFVLNSLIGQNFHLYGIDVISSVIRGDDWTTSSRFPRITMCDFKVRRLGNVQRYTVQCVLPINLFNEKIYLFLWFWMAFVAAMMISSFITWSLRATFPVDRRRYIKKHLELVAGKLDTEDDRKQVRPFVEKYLGQDGVFVLHLVGQNTNAITVTEFVVSLWDGYRKYGQTGVKERAGPTDV